MALFSEILMYASKGDFTRKYPCCLPKKCQGERWLFTGRYGMKEPGEGAEREQEEE